MMFPFFFFNDAATTEIYTLSLHDALPISQPRPRHFELTARERSKATDSYSSSPTIPSGDRKSTRLNSSHLGISYAVFCLKKKKKKTKYHSTPTRTKCRHDSKTQFHHTQSN